LGASTALFPFLSLLFSSFDSQDPKVIGDGIALLCFLVYQSEDAIRELHSHGRLHQLLDFLTAGNEPESLLFLFANAVEDSSVRADFADPLCTIIADIFRANTDFDLLQSAVCCCYSLSLHPIDLSFLGPLLPSMSAIWAKTAAEPCDSIAKLQAELSVIVLKFVAAAREHAELVIESGYLGYLLGVLPFISVVAAPAVVATVHCCVHACGDLSAVTRFIDVRQFLSFLSLPNFELFVGTCELLETLVSRDTGIVAIMIEGGFPDLLQEEVEKRTFREKAALISVLAAMMISEVGDSELEPLCTQRVVEICREVYEMDPGAIADLGGAIARFHAITFDIPELHALVEDLIEG
jgi:hypothetical protein